MTEPNPSREDLIAQAAAALEVRVARLGPDDVIVIQSPQPMPTAILERLRIELERIAPGRKVIIMTEGIELSIVAPTGAGLVLSLAECEEIRAEASRPMVFSGSPAVGWAIAFVRRLADRLAP